MSRTSVLPAGVTLVGAIEGAGDLVVAGTVEGPIELEGGLVIEEGGRVDGDVSVTTLIVRGVLTGDAAARETIRLEGSARVVGDAVAPRVHIVDGARVRGRVRMNGEPMVPKAVRRAGSSAGGRRAVEAPRGPEPVTQGRVRHEHVPPQLAHDDEDAIALEGAPTAVGAPAALGPGEVGPGEAGRPPREARSRPRAPEAERSSGDGDDERRPKRRRRGRRRGGRDRGDEARERPEPAERGDAPRAAPDRAPQREPDAAKAPRKRRRPPPPTMPTVGRQKAKRKDRSDAASS